MKLALRILAATLLAFGALFLVSWFTPITRSDLGLSNLDLAKERCTTPIIPSYWTEKDANGNPDYNREIITNEFAEFSALSSMPYYDTNHRYFDFKSANVDWQFRKSSPPSFGGFRADIYTRDHDDRVLSVAIVFRGTDGWLAIDDQISNLSWLTQLLNPWDQYRQARALMKAVFHEDVGTWRGDKSVEYFAVGHSLGGGLARHISAAFPCTAAVVFNSSFVTNEYRISEPFQRPLVRVFEDLDFLTSIENCFRKPHFNQISNMYQWFRMNNIEAGSGQHQIVRFAAGMGRISTCCRQKDKWTTPGHCKIPKADNRGQDIWCKAMTAQQRLQDDTCNISIKPKAKDCL